MSLVEVKDLSVAFGKKRVVNGASFTLDAARPWRWSASPALASP